jgi:hypothetical protein
MGVTRCGPVRIPHRAVIYPRGHPVPVYTSRAVVPLVRLLSERGTQQEAVRATPGKQPRCFRSDETNAQKRHRTRGPGEACTPQTRPPIPGQLPGPTRHSRCRFHQGTDRAVRGRLFLAPVPGPRSYPEGEPAMVERQTPDDCRTGRSEGLGARGCRLATGPRMGTRGPGPGCGTGRGAVADTDETVTVPRPTPDRSVTSLDSAIPKEAR